MAKKVLLIRKGNQYMRVTNPKSIEFWRKMAAIYAGSDGYKPVELLKELSQ
jgi:hypothetical protein